MSRIATINQRLDAMGVPRGSGASHTQKIERVAAREGLSASNAARTAAVVAGASAASIWLQSSAVAWALTKITNPETIILTIDKMMSLPGKIGRLDRGWEVLNFVGVDGVIAAGGFAWDNADLIIDGAELALDLVDWKLHVATLGATFAAGWAAKKLIDAHYDEKDGHLVAEYERLAPQAEAVEALQFLLEKDAPVPAIAEQVAAVPAAVKKI